LNTPSEILNPAISFLGLTIEEPVTAATDFVTALVCYYSFFRLTGMGGRGKVYLYLRMYFLIMAIALTSAAFLGHAFQAYLTSDYKAIGWGLSALAICFLEMGSAEIVRDELGNTMTKSLMFIMILHLAIFYLFLILPETRNFAMVRISSSISLVGFVLPIHLFHWFKTKHEGSMWFVAAVMWGILPAIVYQREISVNEWFNFHDISHLMMAAYSLILFNGSKKFRYFKENP
jgi:predicted membrane channel-forming protein YqfA (hemolysin III family)